MKNTEISDRFENMRGTHIDRLFWIASCLETSENLVELIEDLNDEQWHKLFPEIHDSQYFEEFKESPIEAFLDFKKLGFIAEIHIPICKNFSFDEKGEYTGYSSSQGYCRIEYVYAETTDELLIEIEKVAEELFQEFIAKEKNNTTPHV